LRVQRERSQQVREWKLLQLGSAVQCAYLMSISTWLILYIIDCEVKLRKQFGEGCPCPGYFSELMKIENIRCR
jgi:hypothetical protein